MGRWEGRLLDRAVSTNVFFFQRCCYCKALSLQAHIRVRVWTKGRSEGFEGGSTTTSITRATIITNNTIKNKDKQHNKTKTNNNEKTKKEHHKTRKITGTGGKKVKKITKEKRGKKNNQNTTETKTAAPADTTSKNFLQKSSFVP